MFSIKSDSLNFGRIKETKLNAANSFYYYQNYSVNFEYK